MDPKDINYNDYVGVNVTSPDGSTKFVPYNVALQSGLVSSAEDLATMQSPRTAYKDFTGAYTTDFTRMSPAPSIKMDDNGKITVTIPDEWKDDPDVKKYTDSYILEKISKNYKADKNVKYQDPYDETKQFTTEEWLDELNNGLKFRIDALNATAPAKANLIARYGGTEGKDNVANSLTTEDVIVMSASFDKDDSWVPIPAYMLLAYPELEKLDTYRNGFVQKNDFLENFYNIEDGKITEANAYGISTTPEKMLSEMEDLTPDEVAKIVAFGNFISQVDPKRSNWSKFWQAGNARAEGFYGGFYDWFVGTSDLVSNTVSLSFITGNTIETRDFWNGMIGNIAAGFTSSDNLDLDQLAEYGGQANDGTFDATKYMGAEMQRMAYTNKDALSRAQAGYAEGRLAGQAVDTVVSLIAVGEATKAISEKITSKIAESGGEAIGRGMAKEAVEGTLDTGVAAGKAASYSTFQAGVELQNEAIASVASKSAQYKLFFGQTLESALTTFSKAVGGATAMLNTMHPEQIANLINSAAKIATTAKYANTAMNVLGSMVIAAVAGNKELTTKVLSSKATSDEAKNWINQVIWDTAKMSAVSWFAGAFAKGANNLYAENIAGTKVDAWLRTANQKASQATGKFFNTISHPWLSFVKWYVNNRTVAGKVSNATAKTAEALKEAVLANEMRAYGANLSTQPGSFGEKLIENYLKATGVERGVTMSETLQNLARAGVTLDPATLQLSEFEAWQSDYAAAQNALSNWGDVQSNISQAVHEFTNPDIQPTISQQMTEISKANADMLKEEQAAGLIAKNDVKFNKGIKKLDNEWYLYSAHSPELARYIVRSYELKVVTNEARKNKVEDLENYQPYQEALARLEKASEAVPEKLRNIVDTRYVPALTKAEHNIVDVMMDDGVYSRSFVEAMRAGGKFGIDGADWMRLVAKKDLPKGAYNPFSKMVKEDNLISLNKFKILEDDQITWPGNGLHELITEYGIARAEKKLVDTGKKATGKTTEIVMSSKKVKAAGLMKEYKTDFNKAVQQGFKGFTEKVGKTLTIGKKRSAEQKSFLNEIATTGGVEIIDIDSLRAIMREKGLPMADDIVDQETLDRFLETASDEARKEILDIVGEKPLELSLTDEGWGDFWGNANPNIRKILRGELEKTSLQTGYGIKDTRARLNAMMPGADVLDWSLLGRDHTNGMFPGGMYAGKQKEVKVYTLDLDDLRKLTGLNKNLEDLNQYSIDKIKKHINTEGGVGVIPIHFNLSSSKNHMFYPEVRWGHSSDNYNDWETYFNYLASQGIEKVPVAIVHDGVDNLSLPELVEEKLGKLPRDITSDVQQAFSEYAQIPLYHNQFDELGTIEANSKGKVPKTREGKLFDNNGAGDAIWLSPNASYTDNPSYGPNKTIGTIPTKYFMSDKEKNDLLDSLFSESEKLYEKKNRGREEYEKKVRDSVAEMMEKHNGPNWRDDEFLADAYEINVVEVFDGKKVGSVDGSKIKEKKLSDKEQKRFDLLHEILGAPSGSGKDRVRSYRALAEYSGKPVIDISEDGFADGTAFFYYKGISPEFDKELNKQLKIQAKGTPYVLNKASTKKINEWADNTTLDKYLDILNQKIPGIDGDIKNFRDILLDKNNYANGKKIYLGVARNAIEDLRSKIDSVLGNSVTAEEEALVFMLDFVARTVNYSPKRLPHDILNASLNTLGFNLSDWPETYTIQSGSEVSHVTPSSLLKALQIKGTTTKGEQAWEAIDPRNFANVPTEPQFKQPRKPTYEDYQRGLSEDEGLTDTILNAIKNEQYNKLAEFKQKNASKYEALINKVDRANAIKNDAVRQSQEIQVAADEFRNNIKDFENAMLFNQKFSYMIKAETAKNTINAFAKENNIELPEGKGSAKNKLKSALWKMLVEGKDLPDIKGLKKTSIKDIRTTLDLFGDVKDEKVLEKINSDKLAKEAKKEFYKLLDDTDLFKNAGGPNPLKYELDKETLEKDVEDAVEILIENVKKIGEADLVVKSMIDAQGYQMSDVRYDFTVLSEILSSEGKKVFGDAIEALSHKIVDSLIPYNQVIIKGNEHQLYNKVRKAIEDKLESRLAMDKATLEAMGEKAENSTVTELLEKYRSEIKGVEEDKLVIKTTDENGDIQYERVSPALADIYNSRPTYTPMGTAEQILSNFALTKKISTTDLSLRSFSKQLVSDPVMAFATVGALPGTLQALRDEIVYQFGPAMLNAIEKNDPLRYENIQAIRAREGISEEEALKRNMEALAKVQVPFTLLNNEILRQANISKFGNEGAAKLRRKGINEKINAGLRRVSDKLGTPQNMRETYVRLLAGETAFNTALQKGFSLEQAENFREYALNTATTNFRQKHTVFNLLRSTVPYLTSGISGAKSFWKMFELDPIGVTSRIFTGFIIPILYFAGEIFSDDNLREKYEALAESEKDNHIVIAVGGELMLIPVGEEIGQYTNLAMHVVETLHGENNYDFWNLMLNDLVNLLPGADLTGFTDPEMLEPLSGQTPNFLEVMENGIAKVLSSTMPPLLQSVYMANTGRDLYTGRRIDTSYVDIDENGNAVIMSKSTSEFAKALANAVGGDAKVIEKVVSGVAGTTVAHVLDTLTSAVQFIGSSGKEGSLMTGVEKALGDLSAPYTSYGYNALERRWNYATSGLYKEKEKIEKSDEYIKYNQEIAKEKDAKKRQNLINKRNDLLNEYQKKVEALVKGYRDAGGSLDKWKFSKAVSLLAFEGAINADRQFMELNTNYSDAYNQAMQTLYNMGITNPDGPSSLGYIYTDGDGNPKLRMWTPAQIQIVQNAYYEQNDIHAARIEAIIDDGTENSLKKQKQAESEAEDVYWNKEKMTNDDYDAIDELRKAYNAKVVLALTDYINTYGATNVLSNDAVIDYLNDIIRVPSAYEKVKGRYVSSDNGKLNKQTGFAESYIKSIFGAK